MNLEEPEFISNMDRHSTSREGITCPELPSARPLSWYRVVVKRGFRAQEIQVGAQVGRQDVF